MTSPQLINLHPILFSQISAWKPLPTELRAQVYMQLPGVTDYKKNYYAGMDCKEELSAFYDDVTHELRCWRQLQELVLEDLTRAEPRLF